MSKIPVSQMSKVCANCVYWAGPRELDAFFGRAEVDESCNTEGKCLNRKGFYNIMRNWQGSCSNFEKHPVIK